MKRRRRAREHVRHRKDRVVLVNHGVRYDDEQVDHKPRGVAGALHALAGDSRVPQVFPVPEIVKENRPTLWDKMRRFSPHQSTRTEIDIEAMGGLHEYSFMRRVRIWGDTGVVVCEKNDTSAGAVFNIEPGARIDTRTRLHWADLSGVDLRGATIVGAMVGTNLSASYLDGATVEHGMFSGRLDGASLRNTKFTGVLFRGASARGADFTGAEFTYAQCEGLDVTDSNLTAEQAATLVGDNPDAYRALTYRRYGIDETCEVLGLSHEDFGIMVWAGDIQVIADTGRVADGSFDQTCHVPQWELNRLLVQSDD